MQGLWVGTSVGGWAPVVGDRPCECSLVLAFIDQTLLQGDWDQLLPLITEALKNHSLVYCGLPGPLPSQASPFQRGLQT